MHIFTSGGTCYDWAYEKIGRFEQKKIDMQACLMYYDMQLMREFLSEVYLA